MKKKASIRDIKNWPADTVSKRVLIVLIALSALVFGAFYLVGYDVPFDDNANFNAPIFTDILLYFIYALLVATVAVCAVAVVRGLKRRDDSEKVSNGVPAAKIVRFTVSLLVLSLILTFVFGSSEPLKISGEQFSDAFWLKATDMFINTSLILMAVAVAAVCYGLSGYNRRKGSKG